jgi:hypothetical protein
VTRGQLHNLGPYVIATLSRVREARGQAKMQRNSLGNLLLEKFWHPKWIFSYFEYESHYIFIIEDEQGIYHEAHIYMERID